MTEEEIRGLLKENPWFTHWHEAPKSHERHVHIQVDKKEFMKVRDWRNNVLPKLEAFLAQFTVPKDIEEMLRKKAKTYLELTTIDLKEDASTEDLEKKWVKLDDVLAVVGAQRAQLKKLIEEFPICHECDEKPCNPKEDLESCPFLFDWKKRLEMLK